MCVCVCVCVCVCARVRTRARMRVRIKPPDVFSRQILGQMLLIINLPVFTQ